MEKICVIIPAYNVEATIAKVISQVSKFINTNHVVVINDGSSDQTGLVATRTNTVVLWNEINRGKGYSLKKGFQYAVQNSYEAIITLDGDLQHDPLEIPRFIDCYFRTNADLILGDRTGDFSNMPLDRQFSNKMTSLIVSILVNQRIRDSQTGYRLIKTELLKSNKAIFIGLWIRYGFYELLF